MLAMDEVATDLERPRAASEPAGRSDAADPAPSDEQPQPVTVERCYEE
jgi:hypothetical protein